MQYTVQGARYDGGMVREFTRTEAVNLRVTPTIKKLLLGIVDADGFGGESEAVVSLIREYATRKRIAPATDERYERYIARRKRGPKRGAKAAQAGTE